MKYEQIESLENKKFCRLTGIQRTTFDTMIAILQESDIKKKKRGGPKNKLMLEERLSEQRNTAWGPTQDRLKGFKTGLRYTKDRVSVLSSY
jgi:hypothetical protein